MSDHAKEELDAISEHLRHYENLFFANVTVFVTVTAGLVAAVFGVVELGASFKPVALVAGVLLTAVSWINATIYLSRAYQFQARIVQLEKLLGYQIFSPLPEHKYSVFKTKWLRPGGLSWHALFLATAIYWVVSLLREWGYLCA